METTGLSESAGCFVGRVWAPGEGPVIVTLRGDAVHDITSRAAPTVTDVLEHDDPAAFVKGLAGRRLGSLGELEADSMAAASDPARRHFLAPNDLQAVKACGVTFAGSMLERVIEERAEGDTTRARAIRERIGAAIGERLGKVRPGSEQAQQVKSALIAEGIWSQYLEVGIGPYAEVFSKAQPMSAVGWGAPVGLHPESSWNNPEPEIVLAVASDGRIKGAALGNDVNLRDFEGRSALLLSKAKDNNASAAIGPFIRLFDESYTLDDVRRAELTLKVEGRDGFVLGGTSSMAQISRDPEDLVAQTCGAHHQYPDGFMLYLGTLFAPTEDRDVPGEGFTHKEGDTVTISTPELGTLVNTVRRSPDCRPWVFGARALMRSLAERQLV